MLGPFSLWSRGFAVALVLAASVAACGNSPRIVAGNSGPGAGGSGNDSSSSGITLMTGLGGGSTSGPFDVEPSALQTITVIAGLTAPTVAYTATMGGKPTSAAWGLDKGNVATIGPTPSSQVVLTPTGTTGGLVTITASASGRMVQRQVMVKLTGQQNGPNGSPGELAQVPKTLGDLTAGGGVGGVGGEGLGTAVNDPATIAALGSPAGNGQAQGLVFLYPYDKTVWPRGILAPLLQWDWSVGDADAIRIRLSTASGSFSWTGTFGRPPILAQTGGGFVRHPIPQDVWQMATDTAGGTSDPLTVQLTVAKGGQAFGPIAETWVVASARLSGIIYYNSYGTQLAKNYTGAVGGDGSFGGAVLSIHVGDTGPKLVAGSNGGPAQCRTCHSVAADGSRLVVQHGDDYQASSSYDLSPSMPAVEHVMANGSEFPGVSPDGSTAITEGGLILPLPSAASPINPTGLTQVAQDFGTPAFSPGGNMVVFNSLSSATITNIMQKLYVMSFDRTNNVFSNPVLVADDTGQPPETRPGWPAFLPDGKSVVFHHQTEASADGNWAGALFTRSGARAQIHWTSVADAQHVTPLNQLNGKDAMGNVYLPKLAAGKTMSCIAGGNQVGGIAADHSDDVNMSYEPTVSPVGAGGYAWVVFTSRRMYGSVADIPPFCSDPRGVDLVQNVTTKKLWVAAIDLGAAPGTDASHPAFYLPAQELLACNSRGFWVLDPCRADGAGCTSGDQCCDGFCQPNGPNGALVCSNAPPTSTCAGTMEKCTADSDCCDPSNQCIDGFCTQIGVEK